MMRKKNTEYLSEVTTLLPPVINTKYKLTPNCYVSAFASCQLARANKIIPGAVKHNLVKGK